MTSPRHQWIWHRSHRRTQIRLLLHYFLLNGWGGGPGRPDLLVHVDQCPWVDLDVILPSWRIHLVALDPDRQLPSTLCHVWSELGYYYKRFTDWYEYTAAAVVLLQSIAAYFGSFKKNCLLHNSVKPIDSLLHKSNSKTFAVSPFNLLIQMHTTDPSKNSAMIHSSNQ